MTWVLLQDGLQGSSGKMAPKTDKDKLLKARTAAIAAVHMRLSEEKRGPLTTAVKNGTGREGWKMAGRAERLGIGKF